MLQVSRSTFRALFVSLPLTFAQVFQRQGITKMTSLNQKFDPNIHGAMFETASTTVEPGTVISEFKSGFIYNDRVLRPAQVGVSKSPDA